MKNFLFIILILFLASCSSKNTLLEQSLQQAGNNRSELEKVLEYYKNDTLKYNAAIFLIENMPYHNYEVSSEIDSIKVLLAHIYKKEDLTEVERQKGITWQRNINSTLKEDLREMKASMLIENIDLAFEVWQNKSWNKNLTFEDFCELILPYRIAEEPLTNWRRKYYEKYNPILDSLYQGSDVVEACNILSNYLKDEKKFNYFVDFTSPRQGADFQFENWIGNCRDISDITIYIMRSVGIPVATDITLCSPEYNPISHEWNVVRDTTGKYLPFIFDQFNATRDEGFTDKRKKGKVFRLTYGEQQSIDSLLNLPLSLQNPFLKDVTNQYFGKNKVGIPLEKESKHVFLGVFTPRNGWLPIGTGKINKNFITFEDIEPFVIYQPLSYQNDELTPIAYPFMLEKNVVHIFTPSSMEDITIIRKFPLRKKGFSSRYKKWLLYTKIKGSNSSRVSSFEKLYEIKSLPPQNFIELSINTKKSYRYYQYEVPKDSVLSIAEIHFFDKKNKEIIFDSIYSNGTPWKNTNFYQLKNSYDNDPLSFFFTKETGTSLFFKSNAPKNITKVVLIPRNDDNFIREGDVYELFYNNGSKGWISLGEKIGTKTEKLHYKAPKNAILWLKNKTRGKEEQIFIYEKERQVFPTFEEYGDK
jgi:hypothetical protein bfra3_15638